MNHLPDDNIGVVVRPDIDLEGCPGTSILIKEQRYHVGLPRFNLYLSVRFEGRAIDGLWFLAWVTELHRSVFQDFESFGTLV